MKMVMGVGGDVIKRPCFVGGQDQLTVPNYIPLGGRAGWGGLGRVLPCLAKSSDSSLNWWPAWPSTHSSCCPFSWGDFQTLSTHAACLTGRLVLSAEAMATLQSRWIF